MRVWAVLAAGLVCIGCEGTISPNPPGTGGGGGDGGSDAGSPACRGVAARSLNVVYDLYFASSAPTTCEASGCHLTNLTSFTFTDAASFYAATVNKPAKAIPTYMLVAPGAPEKSYVYLRLTGDEVPRMPQGGPFLSASQLADVAGWICAGAPPPSGTGGGSGGGAGGGTGGAGGGTGGGAAGGGTGGGGSTGPSITNFSPTSGYVGTTVTVNGSGFSSPSLDQVTFNGTQATVSAATATSITVTVPSGASTGKVSVSVGGQTATSTQNFTVLNGNPVPVLSALTPCGAVAGSGGFTLTVDGINFVSGAQVSFNGASAATTFVSATQVTASITPAMIASAPSGNVADVVVTNPNPGGGASQPIVFGVAGKTSTLAGNVQAIFTASCAKLGCHDAASQTGAMNLEAGSAYANTVGAPSSGCPPSKRVVACNPTRAVSVLIDKILATPASQPCAGTEMPKGAPLTAAEKQTIVDWVAQGAPQ